MYEYFIIFYYMVFYHLIYLILLKYHYYIEEYYYIILNPLTWILYVMITFFVINYLPLNNQSFYINIVYLLTAFSITMINKYNKYLFLLGVMIALFQTEFWELPIYFYMNILKPEYIILNSNVIIQIVSTFVRLLTIIEIIIISRKIGFDYYRMLNSIFIFFIPYSVIVMLYYHFYYLYYLLLPIPKMLFVFRLLCTLLFFIIIYRENKFIYDRKSIIV